MLQHSTLIFLRRLEDADEVEAERRYGQLIDMLGKRVPTPSMHHSQARVLLASVHGHHRPMRCTRETELGVAIARDKAALLSSSRLLLLVFVRACYCRCEGTTHRVENICHADISMN